ncbi:Flp pilus assembly protein, partial [Bifidobacterium italicum]
PTARCVEAVRAAHARIHMREELRRNAFAVPQSTVKMLLGLPAVTVVLGEVLGADPIGVLFGSWQGMCCLGFGGVCYAFGAVWMLRLMRRTGAGDD